MDYSARFYAIPEAQALYRDAIRTVIGRTNSVNGRRYVDNPTVMSWKLADEPRPGSDARGAPNFPGYRQWVHDTAGYIRGLAPKQLVSTGSEGGKGSLGDEDYFIIAHASPNVDYLTFHLWPSNWSWIDHHDPAARLESGLATSLAYIDRHIDIAGKLGKPIVLSEFGLNRDGGSYDPASGVIARDRFYKAIFDRVLERAQAGAAPPTPTGCGRRAIRSPAIRRRKRRVCSRCSTAMPRRWRSCRRTRGRCARLIEVPCTVGAASAAIGTPAASRLAGAFAAEAAPTGGAAATVVALAVST